MRYQLFLRVDQMYFSGIDILRLRPDVFAPAEKVRCVVLAKMRKGVETFFLSGWVQNDLNKSEETIVFDDELVPV